MPGLDFIGILCIFWIFPSSLGTNKPMNSIENQTAGGEIDHTAALGAEDPCFQFAGGKCGF